MSELHSLRIESPHRPIIEGVGSEFHASKLLWARDQSWQAYHAIKQELKIGMNEKDAFSLCMRILESLGVSKHWHKPFVRFGAGTVLTFHDPLREDYALEENSSVYIDLGPVWTDEESGIEYEGDVGDTFVWGQNVEGEKCANAAREIFKSLERIWSVDKCSGVELYRMAKADAESRGYILIENVDGHRVADFPHQKYSRERLAKLEFDPAPLLWVLEIHLRHPNLPIGAFFEDVLGLMKK